MHILDEAVMPHETFDVYHRSHHAVFDASAVCSNGSFIDRLRPYLFDIWENFILSSLLTAANTLSCCKSPATVEHT